MVDEKLLEERFQKYKQSLEARGNGTVELTEDKTEIIYRTKTSGREIRRDSIAVLRLPETPKS